MNRFILMFAALVLSLPLAAQAQFRLLFIGNSFTFGLGGASDKTEAAGGVPGIFDRLAQAGGWPDPTTIMRADPGVDFQYHDSNPTTINAITSRPWTHVVLQNYSTEPTHYADGTHSIARHLTYGASLYQRITSNSPVAKVILYETWSRAAANPAYITGVSGPQSFATTAQMQQELRTNYANLAAALNASHPSNPPVIVAPVGDAWQNAGGLLPPPHPLFVNLFQSDNYHGNDNGYYLAAAVFYCVIYGTSPHGLSSNSQISSLNLNLTVSPTVLEDVAWATVNSTPLKFISQTITNGQFLMTWTGNGQLEWTPSLPGPWTAIEGATNSPAAVEVAVTNRYFRLKQIPP